MRLCSALLFFAICATSAVAQTVDFSNGCGTGWNLAVVPNSPLGYEFKNACNEHDNCYSRCLRGGRHFGDANKCDQTPSVKEARRKVCDRDFNEATDKICEGYPFAAPCRVMSKIYFIAVSLGGSGSFNGREVQDLLRRLQENPSMDTKALENRLDSLIANRRDMSRVRIRMDVADRAVSPRVTTVQSKSLLEQRIEKDQFRDKAIKDVRRDNLQQQIQR
jgi:hypothetical protein